MFTAAVTVLLLGGCSVIQGGDRPSLPDQPEMQGSPPVSVEIVLPDEIYKSMPPAGADSHTATEAQLGWIEDFALRLPLGWRGVLDARVNACRFTARDSCVIVPESKSAG
jgi:hypothetical protein